MNPKSAYYQKQKNKITCSYTFVIQNQKNIDKIKAHIENKTYNNMIFLGQRSDDGYLIRL